MKRDVVKKSYLGMEMGLVGLRILIIVGTIVGLSVLPGEVGLRQCVNDVDLR